MKRLNYLGVTLVTVGFLTACGSSSSTTDDTTDTVEKATGYYLDSAVSGVTYVCGTENNVTGSDGSFTFDVNGSCTFSINGITLRTIDKLEQNGSIVLEDNTTVAQFLQSLDKDGNATNGIDISEEMINALDDLDIDELPMNFSELNSTIKRLQDRRDSNASFEFSGFAVSENEAESHLNETRRENNITTDITDKVLTNSSGNCKDFVLKYISSVTDVVNDTDFSGSLEVSVDSSTCTFTSNGIPNHDFNDGDGFTHAATEQEYTLSVTSSPEVANSATDLKIGEANAILLNGSKVSLLPLGCYGVSDGVKSCTDNSQPYRAVPSSGLNSKFAMDSHNAHTNASGEYHYHASPKALFDTSGAIASPVIGFASDGFPIFGSYYELNGVVTKVESSYQVKSGNREDYTYDGVDYNISQEGDGTYTGEFRDDYEYNATKSPLDECNGMTVNGVYGYYVTDTFPYIINCYTGTKNASFEQ